MQFLQNQNWNTLNIESIEVADKPNVKDDEMVIETFGKTLKFEDERYQVTWPWKTENPDVFKNGNLLLVD